MTLLVIFEAWPHAASVGLTLVEGVSATSIEPLFVYVVMVVMRLAPAGPAPLMTIFAPLLKMRNGPLTGGEPVQRIVLSPAVAITLSLPPFWTYIPWPCP